MALRGSWIFPSRFFHCVLFPGVIECLRLEKTPQIAAWKREGNKMLNIVRGAKVETPYGEGVVINLPVFGRISVRYADGTIRFFFRNDVEDGTIKPVAA